MNIETIKKTFAKTFGPKPAGVVAAPGRVNLIGEHTDYNDGFVLPIAIELRTLAAWSPRDDGRIALASVQQPGRNVELDLCEPIEKAEPKWANYPKGVAAGLRAKGLELPACNILFDSSVPIGSGLSSSASLEVAAGLALLAAAGGAMDGYELALLCQKAEHEFAGTPCGIMDQAISVLGTAGHAMLLDCRDGSRKQIPFGSPETVLLVCDTQVAHELSDGGYEARRWQCYSAAEKLGIPALRDADGQTVAKVLADENFTEKEKMRVRHVVGEIGRTLQAVNALNAGDLAAFGRLMYESHESLRDDYEVSCEELDEIVEIARSLDGVLGARMTGGGFGGCAIVLCQADHAANIQTTIEDKFLAKFSNPCRIFPTHAAAGAEIIE
ncbi:MAG: galactokinase [Phycisphaerae bacterium]|nr:galactokinase [Phycisphaerae bacterium]